MAEGVEIMSTMLKLVDEVEELSNRDTLTPRGREHPQPEEQWPLLKCLLPNRISNLFKGLGNSATMGFGHRSSKLMSGNSD